MAAKVPFPSSSAAGIVSEEDAAAAVVVQQRLRDLGPRVLAFTEQVARRCKAEAFADVTLVADGFEFPAHRFVLASGSEYFDQLFEFGTAVGIRVLPASPADASGEARQRLQLIGASAAGVGLMLRVLYFEATPAALLAEEPSRLVDVVSLASTWRMVDVVEACRNYVKFSVDNIGLLERLAETLSFADGGLQGIRETCHDKLRALREKQSQQRAPRVEYAPEDTAATERRARWAAAAVTVTGGATGGQLHNWSIPLSCPLGGLGA